MLYSYSYLYYSYYHILFLCYNCRRGWFLLILSIICCCSSLIRPGRLEEHIGLELPTLSQVGSWFDEIYKIISYLCILSCCPHKQTICLILKQQRRDIVTSLLHRDNSGLGAAASNSDDVIDLLAESTHGR